MKKTKVKNWRLFAALALLGQTIGGAIDPTIAFADEVIHPQTFTIHYDASNLYEVEGTFSDNRTLT